MNKEAEQKQAKAKPEPPLEDLEIGSALYLTRLTSKFRNRNKWSRPDPNMVKAVIPGTIQKVMVKVGDPVEPGTPLLILEAMKMRNEVRATVHGTVRKIHVRPGVQVPKDQILVEIR
jgi:biotin carboxyl carrier protein